MATQTPIEILKINKGTAAALPEEKDPKQFYLVTDAEGPTTVVIRRW